MFNFLNRKQTTQKKRIHIKKNKRKFLFCRDFSVNNNYHSENNNSGAR